MNSTVKDVMSTHVIAVRRNAPYKEMAAMLHEQRVSASNLQQVLNQLQQTYAALETTLEHG